MGSCQGCMVLLLSHMRLHIALLSCIFPMVVVADELETQLAAGAGVYEMNCAQCHVDGKGGPVAPGLIGTEIVKGSTKAIIEVVLKARAARCWWRASLSTGRCRPLIT